MTRKLLKLREHRCVAYSYGAEHASVALDFRGRPEGFRVIIGEFDGGAAFHSRDFCDQPDGIETGITAGIAAANPAAVVINASEMPGATARSVAAPAVPRP